MIELNKVSRRKRLNRDVSVNVSGLSKLLEERTKGHQSTVVSLSPVRTMSMLTDNVLVCGGVDGRGKYANGSRDLPTNCYTGH
ncbi:hypothetical protein TNCT_239161 [Trichonephila clavata]|uniref:Uncharacterized protein n=1 Tax=Trichonephila clavata TaxID=2740835 RepID=A0A8X6HCJ7_TRICU|nr:hypothetical protein TNCT_239161 [Trichonephila clavata]